MSPTQHSFTGMCQALCWGHCREDSPRGGGARQEAATEDRGQSRRGWWAGGPACRAGNGRGRAGSRGVGGRGREEKREIDLNMLGSASFEDGGKEAMSLGIQVASRTGKGKETGFS